MYSVHVHEYLIFIAYSKHVYIHCTCIYMHTVHTCTCNNTILLKYKYMYILHVYYLCLTNSIHSTILCLLFVNSHIN